MFKTVKQLKRLLVVLIFTLFACQHKLKDDVIKSKNYFDHNLVTNAHPDTNNRTTVSYDTILTLVEELKKALQDTATDEYFIQVFNRGKIIMNSDDRMLSITDSLFSKDANKDFFYFLVFTKSMNNSDGFYSESLGFSALEFITTNTETFAYYFSNGPNLTDNDIRNWANSIIGEVQISKENQESEAIKELEAQLRNNIKRSNKEYAKIIDKLIQYLEIIGKERSIFDI